MEWGLPGAGGGGVVSWIEFQFGRMKTVLEMGCTAIRMYLHYSTVHFKISSDGQFYVIYILPHLFKKLLRASDL